MVLFCHFFVSVNVTFQFYLHLFEWGSTFLGECNIFANKCKMSQWNAKVLKKKSKVSQENIKAILQVNSNFLGLTRFANEC